MHWIRTYILEQLLTAQYRRNKDLRPARVDSNLLQYHLSQLVKQGYVMKTAEGYTYGAKGQAWADRYSGALRQERRQSKLTTIIALQDVEGRTLLIPKKRQPFIGQLYFPMGKVHEAEHVADAVQRELHEKLQISTAETEYVDWIHIVVRQNATIVTDYIGFIFKAAMPQGYTSPPGSMWVSRWPQEGVAPGMESIFHALSNTVRQKECDITLPRGQNS